MTQAQQVKIFCSYAHEDQLFIHHLKTHFALLERLHPWVLWTDAEIHAGEEWEQTIQEHLDTAQIILLLVSPDFIASDYCYSKEMVRAMERHEQKEAYVIPILIRHVAQQWKNTPLGKLEALPADGKPITDRYWHTTDAALCHVVEKISQVISLHARGNEASTTGRVAIQAESEQPDTVTSQLLKPQPLSHFLAQSGSIQIERAGIKIFEHQQDAYDFLSQIIHRNGAKEAVLFQYSCQIRAVEPPLDLQFGRSPTQLSLRRYQAIPEEGMNRFDLQRLAPELTPACWIKKQSGGTDLFGRLWWDRPSVTIRTEFFKPEKGRYLHPVQHRPITHREAARFQSFPDNFRFCGSKTSIARQIGNAVPPLLAAQVANCIYSLLVQCIGMSLLDV